MTYYKQISITIDNESAYNIYFAYNNVTNFSDLFGFISYNNPEKNISLCSKIQYRDTSNNRYYDLSMNEKVYYYLDNKGFTQYKIINNRKCCNCHEKFKNNKIKEREKEKISVFRRIFDEKIENRKCYNYHEIFKRLFKLSKYHLINIIFKYMNDLEYKINNIKKEIEYDSNGYLKNINFFNSNYLNNDEFSYYNNNYLEEELEESFKFIHNLNSIFEKGINNLISVINSKMKNYKDEIDKLKEGNKILSNEINKDINIDKINQLKKLGISENLQPRLNLIRLDPITNKYIGNETSIKKDFTEFYDIIIDIKSITDISKGWEIKKSKRAETNYEQFKKEKVIKIGVIGNSNKGKSFLLSKISKVKDIPSGTSINTEGLSVKYPELDTYKDRKIVLLDSAGLETPVLNENINNNFIIPTNEDNKNNKTNINNERILINGKNITKVSKMSENPINERPKIIDRITKEKENNLETDRDNKIIINQDKQNNNEIKTENLEKENIDKQFQNNSREKLITELFLQNYIINNSDILIIVVGILTYSEQKLLYKIKKEILKTKNNRPLFIIHNLITFTTIEQVEDYIKNILYKSSTFTLECGHKISTKTTTKTGVYYYEKNIDANIYHLIFANEGSKAGEYYNNLTLDFIENSYQNVINLKPFDIIETVKERFIEISNEIIEKIEKPLSKNDFDNSNDKYIKLNNQKNITLKKCLINELGISNLITNGFEPTYNLYKTDNLIQLNIEASGNSSISSATIDFERGEYIHLIVKGTKKKDKLPEKWDDNIYNKRKFGNFYLDIPISREYILKNEDPEITEKKGVIFIKYKLDNKKKGGALLINEEDEI